MRLRGQRTFTEYDESGGGAEPAAVFMRKTLSEQRMRDQLDRIGGAWQRGSDT